MALSVKRVRGLMKKPGRYFDRDGFYLVVKTPTNASWQLRYERHGVECWHGGGSAALFDLAEAREWARSPQASRARH